MKVQYNKIPLRGYYKPIPTLKQKIKRDLYNLHVNKKSNHKLLSKSKRKSLKKSSFQLTGKQSVQNMNTLECFYAAKLH